MQTFAVIVMKDKKNHYINVVITTMSFDLSEWEKIRIVIVSGG